MESTLLDALKATDVKVEDISGGCGSMYRVEVESPMFAGVPLVKQHRMVNEVLKSEITVGTASRFQRVRLQKS